MTVADGDVGGPGPPCNPRGHPQSGGAVQSTPGTNNPSSGSGSNPILMASPAGNNPINLSEMTFEKFKEEMPSQAEGFLGQLREISGVNDIKTLHLAFNKSRREAGGEFSVANAIEWIFDEPRHTSAASASLGMGDASNASMTAAMPMAAPSSANLTTDCGIQPDVVSQQQNQRARTPQTTLTAIDPLGGLDPLGDAATSNNQQVESMIAPAPPQPPNSPTAGRVKATASVQGGLVNQGGIVANMPAEQGIKPLVDLTEGKDAAESDIQKAIKLSLQDQTTNFGGNVFSQEDQDVSRALEASLLESSGAGGKRKRGADSWIDPQNPHERERQGAWPVGLKNVGQTCWFSAVIQSLFYLPTFRQLVLSFQPSPEKQELLNRPVNGMKHDILTEQEEKTKKSVLFMLELRNLFSLMLASTRKYLDPTRAVELLKGNIGNKSSNGNGNSVTTSENIQQDVSEFTHIFLDWLEEAFKSQHDSSATTDSEAKDESMEQEGAGVGDNNAPEASESENNSGHEDSENVDPNRQSHRSSHDPATTPRESPHASQNAPLNPITRLIYGKILTEGCLHGQDFSRTENFGQYPLQVNNFSDLHESIESSTARSALVVSSSSSESTPSAQQSETENRQEQWFTELPPVLFFSLSRFQFNTERGFAEKIHNRLEFSERIYMDRYMSVNKNITRSKREEVRRLKEQREGLKRKRQKFTHYGATDPGEESDKKSTTSHCIPLQYILQYTMDFATGRDPSNSNPTETVPAGASASTAPFVPPGQDFNMASPQSDCTSVPAATSASSSTPGALQPGGMATAAAVASGVASSLMQVDSPCHSPKMTPASSSSNLTAPPLEEVSEGALKDEDTPMDVEDGDEMNTSNGHGGLSKNGCDPTANGTPANACSNTSATESEKAKSSCTSAAERPKPRSVSEEERRVIMNCLSRWKEEVLEDISTLEASIAKIDGTISAMYTDTSLKQHEYRLHAVMVHEGSVDAGHYWAYVLDHKRNVWLKCNDNTVNEATWDELARESMGGHSNTSAYSLIYINASRPELTQESDSAGGDGNEDRMEQSVLEALIQTLPNDLAEYVTQDNRAFEAERSKWDHDQEEKKKQEAVAKMDAESSGGDAGNELMVVKEKLTYVNTHAKLSLEVCRRLISDSETMLKDRTAQETLTLCIDQAKSHFVLRAKLGAVPNSLDSTPTKLESFIVYLIRNGVDDSITRLALLEQFSILALDNEGTSGMAIRQAAQTKLDSSRLQRPAEAAKLKEWHQAYHMFRVSANAFILGVDQMCMQKYEEALDSLTVSYNISQRISERDPEGSSKTIRPSPVLRFISLCLKEVNSSVIKQFKLGENLQEVHDAIAQLMCPALHILDLRQAQDSQNNGGDPANSKFTSLLEDIRGQWCGMLGDDVQKNPNSAKILSDLLSLILGTYSQNTEEEDKPLSRNRDHIDQQMDLAMANNYRKAMKKGSEKCNGEALIAKIPMDEESLPKCKPKPLPPLIRVAGAGAA